VRRLRGLGLSIFLSAASLALLPGCPPSQTRDAKWQEFLSGTASDAPRRNEVPYPIRLLLPEEIQIDSFTGTRTFDKAGGIKGIHVRVKALDAYGDVTKAFGKFRFELYRLRTNSADRNGEALGRWNVDLSDPKVNIRHWDNIPPGYKFRLQWSRSIPVGEKFMLVTVFSSPFTERIFAERVFLSGQ